MDIAPVTLRPPYLVFVGEEPEGVGVKTGAGVVQWRRELCLGQLRLSARAADLGLPDMSLEAAREAGAGSLLVGAAPIGGVIAASWRPVLARAAELGMDVVAGLHARLADEPELREAARRGGARLVDVRTPPAGIPVGTGRRRTGRRLLTVGADCAVGKKYTALQLERDLRAAGVPATFRATGQTGIMIAGHGIPLDAVVSDFLTGAAEVLSPDNAPDHWDVIEGQGGIFHPGYAPVTLGLLLGSQPDAFVVCHDAAREALDEWPDFPVPTVDAVIERTIALGKLTNPEIACVGVSINTSRLPPAERAGFLAAESRRLGLPCIDPLVTGAAPIVERVRTFFPLAASVGGPGRVEAPA